MAHFSQGKRSRAAKVGLALSSCAPIAVKSKVVNHDFELACYSSDSCDSDSDEETYEPHPEFKMYQRAKKHARDLLDMQPVYDRAQYEQQLCEDQLYEECEEEDDRRKEHESYDADGEWDDDQDAALEGARGRSLRRFRSALMLR